MTTASASPQQGAARRAPPTPLVPDRALVRRVLAGGGDAMGRCMQCATCSAVCELSARDAPLPRKEMLWAQWGLRERLVADVDLWLCHECHDCTLRCPRGARPGDVMAALRQECVGHFSMPRFAGRWAARPRGLLALTLVAAIVLAVGVLIGERTGLGVPGPLPSGAARVIPFWTRLPHGLLFAIFGGVALFDFAVLTVALARFWRALGRATPGLPAPGGPVRWGPALRAAVTRSLWHEDFARCTSAGGRRVSHALVAYGMVGLIVVDAWVIVSTLTPLGRGLAYPLGLTDPWKLLANLAGAALLVGLGWMSRDRLQRPLETGAPRGAARPTGAFGDWQLLGLLLAAVLTGFLAEGLHLLRVDVARHAAYALHLLTVLVLLLALPYSKLAHVAFRSAALLFVERHDVRRPARGPHGARGPVPAPSEVTALAAAEAP